MDVARPMLTKETAAAAKPDAARYELRDKKIAGLRLIVQPSGVRTWALRYKLPKGQARRYTIGAYSEALGLDEARKIAAKVKLDVVKGADPAGERRQARRTGTTVRAVFEEYSTLHLTKRRDSTVEAAKRLFDKGVLPKWGRLEIASIKRRDVMALLDGMREHPAKANKAKARLNHFFGWAVEREIIEASPVTNVRQPNKPKSRDRVLTDNELRRVWNASDTAGYPFGPIVKLLILTISRRSEVAAMTWAEVNEKESLWTLPEKRSKNGLAHEVHLSAVAFGVLASVPRVGDFVFSTRDNRPVSGFAKMKSRIDSFIGEGMADWTLHDLRRTGATLLQRLKFSREVIDACQNHKPGGVSSIYQRYAFRTEKAQAFEALAREVERITNGDPSNVVAMVRHAT
jgi:integrase